MPRPDWKNAFGGDAVQMQATAKHLRELGATVDIARPEDVDLSRYDVIHLWTSLQTNGDLIKDVDMLQSARKRSKLVHSPVWAPQHVLRWMFTARSWLFPRHPDLAGMTLDSAHDDLKALAQRTLTFHTEHGDVPPYGPQPDTVRLRSALDRIDMLLPNSWMELQAIQQYFGSIDAFHIVPNAVDTQAFLQEPEFALPAELQGVPFAMMSARFDPRKQQDMVILALKDLDIPLVFAGHGAGGPIFERFRTIGSRRKAPVYYFNRLDQMQLRTFYRAARVHFMPSIFESPGLSNIEAALLDCSIVVGCLAFELEYFKGEAYYADPCDMWSIRHAVKTAFDRFEQDGPRRAALKQRILNEFTWERAAAETYEGYRRVLRT